MARDHPVRNGEESPDRPDSSDRRGHLLDRRDYLKLAGATTAAGAALATGVTAADDFEVIEARGQVVEIGSGETFENKIIDYTTGDWCRVQALGTNWTIRNVGFLGAHDRDENAMAVADMGGGTSVIENVYMGDGAIRPSNFDTHGQIAIWVHYDHDGHIDIRNCNFQGWPNNAVYASAPGGRGNGSIHIDSCYAANNYVASYRLATGQVTNSVAELDENGYDGRCVWVWPGAGDVLVDGCELQTRGRHYAIVTRDGVDNLTVRNTSYDTGFHGGTRTSGSSSIDFGDGVDNDPQATVPDGVPTSAEEAAGSSVDHGGDHPELQHVFEFVAADIDEPTDYYFEIEEGPIKHSTVNGATIEDSLTWVSEDGSRAAGRVTSGRHAWEFDTLLVDVTVDGPATPIINGSESYLPRYPLEGATGDEWKGDMPWHQTNELPNLLLIDGSEETGSTSYEFAVSGSVEKSTAADASVDEGDRIDSGHVVGSVAGWRDAFRFDGELELLTVSGPATVTVNGEEVDPDDFGEPLPHVLTVAGVSSSNTYEVSVDGEIEPIAWDEAAFEASVGSDQTVEGWLEQGDSHRFRFSGEIADATVTEGEVRFYVDGQRYEPGDSEPVVLPHAIVIDGRNSGATSYSFSIAGDIVKSSFRDASKNDGDVLEGTSATGSVNGGLDAYWFEGDIVDLDIDGDATVDVEYDVHDG